MSLSAVFLAIILVSFLVVLICIPLSAIFMWITSMYGDARHQFSMARLSYLRRDIEAGDRYKAAGDAIMAKADVWADRFHVGKSKDKEG